jgi:hypothetical protein
MVNTLKILTSDRGASMLKHEAEYTALKSPIDVMYLVHKALRTHGVQAEDLVRNLGISESLQAFRIHFNEWASALAYHAIMEDQFMTSVMPKLPQVHENEESHRKLEQRLEAVVKCLDEEIGKKRLIPRTQRHLYGKVVSLQIAQDDHLEEEEEFVLPLVRQHFSEEQQRDIIRRILIDDQAADCLWVLKWLGRNLSQGERRLIEELRVNNVPESQMWG